MTRALFDLAGQVALVTGTSRGLGQYFARALASAGAGADSHAGIENGGCSAGVVAMSPEASASGAPKR